MTYYEEDEVVPELKPRLREDDHGVKRVYLNLGERSSAECEPDDSPPSPRRKWRGYVWCWVKLALLFSCLGILAGVCLKWVWPFFMDKVGNWRFLLFLHRDFTDRLTPSVRTDYWCC